ncbi:hypothetical protein N7499_010069 [Penicillium canescens]|uniref:Deacetylase complex subunit Sds3 n=1 Tax=Penicillium canescens TaxID=5083 RepID=A0AAD6NDQ7_PENCN|nr:uncharacterized protein N7446_007800 [Penicillium canescens]KAJ6018748.1 hypothetical protein N7522_000815 [Penicillium canescens]KAJ6033905.1 hypothetical protein N7444_011676 [Penicillium canescens]KAJ6056907.1 hypothetical protein N7460_000181 [Penicillium canescens]KAJ6058217.1 hypothetical protein N7446_007800 [Penicillium canescens]KAJ6072055.1 hypothetical protein N7499_010069 [Penicillium canescens]
MSYPNAAPTSPGGGASGAPSKRDKRRTALQERLQELTAQFSHNRDIQFRQQLHALQCDMTLINNADPYGPGPLLDTADSIAALIEETVGGGSKFAKEMAGLAGSWYSRFVQQVNQVKETRDANLTATMNGYNDMLERQQREHDFRVYFAKEEFNQLSTTLRERLVQNISGKRARLMREKEQLDIADTNALLLHPNQFSITNPASPGGIHSNRKTRHTRHRVDLDELGNGVISELNKRKRKAPEEEAGSPARDTGDATPAKRAKAEITKEQLAPTYSIHSLFTDKELSAHANQAHVAAVHFFSTSKRPDHGSGAVTNGNNTDAEDTPEGTGNEDNGTPSAADMMRTASHNYHATRSTRTTAAHSALSALADLADKPATRPNLPYHVLSNYHARPNGNAPPLTSLMNEEVDDDCARMSRLSNKPLSWIDHSLVELVAAPLPSSDLIDGHVPDPNTFSQLHPDFSPAMAVDWTPAAHNPAPEMFPPTAMERERSRKRTRNH